MKKLLHIIASPRADKSASEKLAEIFQNEYARLNPDAEIDILDLWKDPIPQFDAEKVAARMTFLGEGTLEGSIKEAWNEVKKVAERFTSADDFLISVPMWNGGIPWILKQYIDTVTQPGITFGFGKDGFFPLLKSKKAAVVYTSAIYSPTLPKPFGEDFQASYINWWLGSIGVSEVYPIQYYSNIYSPEKAESLGLAEKAAKMIAAEHFSY
jgi:FMN-dependent NADH-azoreductase